MPNGKRYWLQIIKIGNTIYERTNGEAENQLNLTFQTGRGPRTFQYKPNEEIWVSDTVWETFEELNTNMRCLFPKCYKNHLTIQRKKQDKIQTLIASLQRGTSLKTYYISGRDKKRGDLTVRWKENLINLTPIKGVSQRFPEMYKHLTKKENKWIKHQPFVQILETNPKEEIWQHVLKNIDNPTPERRFGPRDKYPSRFGKPH